MHSNRPATALTDSKTTPLTPPQTPTKLINVAGFDWDETLLPFHSAGYLFLLGDDNKEDHEALMPTLLECLGDYENKRKCFAELKKFIDRIFIHTQGIEVNLVDEQGDPLPKLFYSGKEAVEKYLEALFGKEWQKIISGVHGINVENSNPRTKAIVCLTNAQYEKLRNEIHAFRKRWLVREDKSAFKLNLKASEDAAPPPKWHDFDFSQRTLREMVENANNGMITFNKPLRADQNNLSGKALHWSDELKNIKETDPNAQINYLFMVDDSDKNCMILTACRGEFKDTVKKFVTIHHEGSKIYRSDCGGPLRGDVLLTSEGWFRAIQMAMSQEPQDIEQFQQRTVARHRHDYGQYIDNRLGKTFFTDFETEIKGGNAWIIENLHRFYKKFLPTNKMDEFVSLVILAAKCANEEENENDLEKRHQIFFKLLGEILSLAKKSSHTNVLKACFKLFKDPEIKRCFANIKQKTSLVEFLTFHEYGIYENMENPLAALKYFLEFVKDNAIKDPKHSPLIVKIMSRQGESRETIDIVKQLIEERGVGFEGKVRKTSSIYDPAYHSALSFSIGYDPDDKDRFGLCKYLLAKGANIDDINSLFIELIEKNNLSGVKYICEKTPFDWAHFIKEGSNPLDLVCRRFTFVPDTWMEKDNYIKPKEYLALAKYFVDIGLKPTVDLDAMLLGCSEHPEVQKFINEVLKPVIKNPDVKPKEFKQTEATESKDSKASPVAFKSSFDPLYTWGSYLTDHHDQFNENDFDDLIYYARWFFATGENMQKLIFACDQFFAANKLENTTLLDAVRCLVATSQPPVQVKPFKQLKREFAGECAEVKFPLPKETVEAVSKCFEKMEYFQKEISKLDIKQFNKRLVETIAACKLEFKNNKSVITKHTNDLLALLRYRYWHITGLYPHDVQMFNLIALITDPDKCKLAQIKTGEGKTTLIALLAAYYGLLGLKPDIFTTHDDLAKRDVDKLRPFYNSVGLAVGYEAGSRNTDQSVDILYGTTRTIQGNWLGNETGQYFVRGSRPFDIAIFDEADHLFIDSKNRSLSLLFTGINYGSRIELYRKVESHFAKNEIHPEKWISNLAQEMKLTLQEGEAAELYKAWSKNNKSVFEAAKTSEVSAFYTKIHAHFDQNLEQIAVMAKAGNVALKPEEAKQIFTDWVLARHLLKIYEDYHVTYDEYGPCVQLIDRHNTGQREINFRLKKAHTFLEIINHIPPELLEAIFCQTSNGEFLKLYQYGCKCVTGTGGVMQDRNELRVTCGMSTYDSPSNKPNIRQALPNKIVEEAKFNDSLKQMVKEHCVIQEPVVIFADTVAQSNQFAEMLREIIGQEHIQVYNALQNEPPESIIKNASLPGMVTIVTNIGGRGMDIVTTEGHPLHLIFTNLFKNRRVESQAIGRTGRQGKKGTYNYLLSAKKVCERLLEPQSNAGKIIAEGDAAIERWYDIQRDDVLKSQKSEYIRLQVTHVVQMLQHLFMTLPDHIREGKFYRWTTYISNVGSYENTAELSGEKLLKKAIDNTLKNFIKFWKEACLSSEILTFMLSTHEHAEIAQIFQEFALVQPIELIGLRRNSMYAAGPMDAKAEKNLLKTSDNTLATP